VARIGSQIRVPSAVSGQHGRALTGDQHDLTQRRENFLQSLQSNDFHSKAAKRDFSDSHLRGLRGLVVKFEFIFESLPEIPLFLVAALCLAVKLAFSGRRVALHVLGVDYLMTRSFP
jgi:hypothetical protein